MNKLIERIFQKRGIEDANKLSPEEKQTFEGWEKVLSKEELTLEDVKSFCQSQVDIIETRWKDLLIKKEDKSELIPYHTVYKTLLSILSAPKSMREVLETQLQQILNQ